jgi:hypothetical protein
MTPRQAAVLAVAATTAVVAGFCAWFLRPQPEIERLATFPRAFAEAIADGNFSLVESCLAPEFTWRGAEPCGRDEALARLRQARAGGKFRPAAATSAAVRADEDRFRLVVYGVVIEGDPERERRPATSPFRLEALVEVRGRSVRLLEAGP